MSPQTPDTTPGSDARPAAPHAPQHATKNDVAEADGASSSVLKDWVLPIVVGLALGAGVMVGWRALRSEPEKAVEQWPWDDPEKQDELAGKIRALGKEAREDVLAAFRSAKVRESDPFDDDRKFWIGQILALDPFLDTASLAAICRDPQAPVWDRRIAAGVLADVLGKGVDPELVTDLLLEWLEDPRVPEHNTPSRLLRGMQQFGVFPPDRDARLRKALVDLAGRKAATTGPEGEDFGLSASDRQAAVRALAPQAKEAEVQGLLWKLAADESEDTLVRVVALQVLSEQGLFDRVDAWKGLLRSADGIVRQAAAENLVRCDDPAFSPDLEALHGDRLALVRAGSVMTQARKKRASPLRVFEELMEDHSPVVRAEAMEACAILKDVTDGIGRRQAIVLRLLAESDEEQDISAAAVALKRMTGQTFGFADADVDLRMNAVSDNALAAFKADEEGRAKAVEEWRRHLGATAVWTVEDRRKVLEKLLGHADPDNVARAKAELAKLGGS